MPDFARFQEISKIVGGDLWFFRKNLKLRTSPKLKPKRVSNDRFSRQKWTHATDPRIRSKNDTNALQMTDLATFQETSKIVGDDL